MVALLKAKNRHDLEGGRDGKNVVRHGNCPRADENGMHFSLFFAGEGPFGLG